MLRHVYIVPFAQRDNLPQLDSSFYVRCSGYHEISETNAFFKGNDLYEGVIIDSAEPLCFAPFSDDWKGKDIIVKVASIGSLRLLLAQIDLLKTLRLRVCLPANANADVIKIFSSSGIWCRVDYSDGPVDWKSMDALSEYSFSKFPIENRIEPFECLTNRYRPQIGALIPPAGFERFDVVLNMDLVDNLLVVTECSMHAFCDKEVKNKTESDAEWLLKEDYQYHYNNLTDEECLKCNAYRLCRSSIDSQYRDSGSCQVFFAQLMSCVEQRLANPNVLCKTM